MKSIVITGYDGFIGTNLVSYLQSKNLNVIGISDRKNKKTNFKTIQKDIRKIQPTEIPKKTSLIIHLAALTDVDYCENHSDQCFDINVLGTMKILEAARKNNSKLIFISSSHVFGNPKKIPIKESDPKNPISVYGASKLCAEQLCETYSKKFDMDISIIRLFSVYGKKENGNDVISKIISQMMNKNSIQLGNLYPKRDFVYVNDVINAIHLVMQNSKKFKIFNVGTMKSYSIFEIYKILKDLTGKNVQLKSKKSLLRKTDIENVVADNSKIKTIGWKTITPIKKGLGMILQQDDNKLKTITKCRICKSDKLTPIISLDDQYLAGYSPKANDPIPILKKFPLELIRCDPSRNSKACGLVQLKHSVFPDFLYGRYFYMSGINKTMTENLKEIVDQAISEVKLDVKDIVVDIGCNDGTLLKNYQNLNVHAVGFDPAKNMAKFSRKSGAKIIVDYFNANSYKKNFGTKKAKIVTSIAMFYDLENPNNFVKDVSQILHKKGVWLVELSYLPSMLIQNAFDTIVHEHLEYYHLKPIEYMLNKFNLKIADVFLNEVNGGSVRIFIKHKDQPLTKGEQKRISDLRKYEKNLKLDTDKPYKQFFNRCKKEREKLVNFIKKEVKAGKKFFAYGASTKGNTLLQFYGLDNSLIKAVADRNPDKWGRRTVGTNLKIISEENARKAKPDYFFVLPWHFIEEFKQREINFLKKGGKLIVPLPTFKIIQNKAK